MADRTPVDIYSDDVLTVPASLAGLPAISIPCLIDDDQGRDARKGPATTGLQLIAQFGDEEMVFRAAKALEKVSGNFRA